MTGGFTYQEMVNIVSAAQAEGKKASQVTPYTDDPWEAFRELYNIDLNHPFRYEMVNKMCSEGCFGRTLSDRHVEFYRYYLTEANTRAFTHIDVSLVIHENAHAFENALARFLGYKPPRNQLSAAQSADFSFPDRPDNCGSSDYCGFAGDPYQWQQSISGAPEEEFADMFIGWAFNRWENTELGRESGQARSNFMNTYMPLWVNLALTK